MERKISFNEMNPYIRYVQRVEGLYGAYYLPWRILYDNLLLFIDKGMITLCFENHDLQLCENECCIIPPFLKNKLEVRAGEHSWYYGCHFDFYYDDSEEFNEDVYIPENLGWVKEEITEMPVDESLEHRTVYRPQEVQFPEKIYLQRHMEMRTLFAKLLGEFQKREYGSELMLKSYFYAMLDLLVNEIQNMARTQEIGEQEAIRRYIRNLTDDGDNRMDMVQIALEYGMSPKKFRSVFKEATQKRPKEYIIETKMKQAKELLDTGRYQVREIAYMLGYDDVFYFSKLFKKKVGLAPKHYQKRKR